MFEKLFEETVRKINRPVGEPPINEKITSEENLAEFIRNENEKARLRKEERREKNNNFHGQKENPFEIENSEKEEQKKAS